MTEPPAAWLAEELAPAEIEEAVAGYVQHEIRYEETGTTESGLRRAAQELAPTMETDEQYRGMYKIDASRVYGVLESALEQYDDGSSLEEIGELVGDGITRAFKEERREKPRDTRYRFDGDSTEREVINGLAETVAANIVAAELREEHGDREGVDSLVDGLWRNPGTV